MNGELNSFGLYDAPVRIKKPETIELTEEDIAAQCADGAFFMTYEEAVQEGFINPHDEQDTCIVSVRRQA